MKKTMLLWLWCAAMGCATAGTPVDALLERIDEGASKKFVIEKQRSDSDFFELDQKGSKVVVRGNTYVSELVVPLYPQPPKGGFNAGNQQPPPASPLQGVGGLNTNA